MVKNWTSHALAEFLLGVFALTGRREDELGWGIALIRAFFPRGSFAYAPKSRKEVLFVHIELRITYKARKGDLEGVACSIELFLP